MHVLGKEYRVVCSQTPDMHTVIDIVPANNALHQLILQERQQRSPQLKVLAGSIALYDMGEGNKPEILFLPPEHGGLSPIELSPAEENRLRFKIAACFEEMMAKNQKSTITIRPEIHRAYVDNIVSGMVNGVEAVSGEFPKSSAEEAIRQSSEKNQHRMRTRQQTDAYLRRRDSKYSPYNLSALQIKQLLQRDY